MRANGALNGSGIADMKGWLSIMLGALEAFETIPFLGAHSSSSIGLKPNRHDASSYRID
jgi:hypothetical protein